MSSHGSSSRGSSGQYDDAPPPRQAPGPKLQVQRSLSRDTITIHFSALGKDEDDEEEELYGMSDGAGHADVSGGAELRSEFGSETSLSAAVLPLSSSPPPHTPSPAMAIVPTHPQLSCTPPTSSSWPSDRPSASPPPTSSSSSSPSRSGALSSSKPFLSLVRSLSGDVEPRETPPPPGAVAPSRHRHLMKSLVKSLSSDSSKAEHQEGSPHPPLQQQPGQPTSRPPPRNMQLFKQFSQPRLSSSPAIASQVGGDSKTAPSSPITSPDGRSFFKVQEVEAKIEDTKRRLSEVMSDPLQLFSKIMGDESGVGAGGSSAHRARLLSSSASELSGTTAVNGHAEGPNSYSIKEEEAFEGEEEEDTPTGKDPYSVFFSFPSTTPAPAAAPAAAPAVAPAVAPPPSSTVPRSPSLSLARCSMSALVARQEDEDFCQLYSEDFDACSDTETPDGGQPATQPPHTGSTGVCSELDPEEDDRAEDEVPTTGLVLLTQMVYWYLVLPVPPCVCAVVQGIVAGWGLAMLVLWLSAPRRSSLWTRTRRRRMELWNVAQLDIREPGIFKGWMNEIHSYDPETYHATLTHSVYVRLEGSVLRLSKPNRNIPRRAAHNEPRPDVTYISQKIYDVTDSKILLVPQSLARKRVWNKKYPICIQLAKQDDFMSKAQGDGAEGGEDPFSTAGEQPERLDKAEKGDGSGSADAGGGGDLTIYLFGRTGREKEEWFRRLLHASRVKLEGRGGGLPAVCKSAFQPSHSRSSSNQSTGGPDPDGGGGGSSVDEPCPPQSRHRDAVGSSSSGGAPGGVRQRMLLDYNVYMAKYVNPPPPSRSPTATDSPELSPDSSPKTARKSRRRSEETVETQAWVNALLGRVFWDFLGEKYWANVVSKKIQMKLSKIRLPYVMNELTLTELDMGFSVPKILQASKPSVDHQGLWFDLEVSYTGSFLMTLETKMNLARLGKEGEGLGEQGKEWSRPRTYCLADSDEESSSAGSSDEEEPSELLGDKAVLPGGEGSYVGGHRPSKIMRFVDKIAKSKYFQKATETEFIKKKMEEVSNTPLLLTVEVQECRGTLAVNIPPPPTDRIWYGFRSPPHLELKARPKLGEREVTLVHVTEWIEKKLEQEFQKIFVMPNMDDVWLPVMHSAMDTRSNANEATLTSEGWKEPESGESKVADM